MKPSIEIAGLNSKFETESPGEILVWASETFNPEKIAVTSSFQSQSVPLLHIISQFTPDLPVLFIDTGFHFPETLVFKDQLERVLGLNIKSIKTEISPNRFKWQTRELYHNNPDLCCYINKVKPFQDAKLKLQGWITGIRRDQTGVRASTSIISVDDDGLYKICPMATWTRDDVWSYIYEHKLPVHPLRSQGYMSIGCAPCTRPVLPGEGDREGRWSDQLKTECGLHISIENESVDS